MCNYYYQLKLKDIQNCHHSWHGIWTQIFWFQLWYSSCWNCNGSLISASFSRNVPSCVKRNYRRQILIVPVCITLLQIICFQKNIYEGQPSCFLWGVFYSTPKAIVQNSNSSFQLFMTILLWWFILGNNHMKEDNYAAAVECYTRAIELDPNNAVYYCNRWSSYKACGYLFLNYMSLFCRMLCQTFVNFTAVFIVLP